MSGKVVNTLKGWLGRSLCNSPSVMVGVSGALALALTGCGVTHSSGAIKAEPETFASAATYSRLFDASPQRTCEAARRALLGQGYLINIAKPQEVEGQKSFQPAPENHQTMTIRIVCVPDTADGKVSMGFVSALKDTYALRKSSSSASVGVGGLGSLSLPFTGGNDSMVKIGSETVSSSAFYDSFFELIKNHLRLDEEPAPIDDNAASK